MFRNAKLKFDSSALGNRTDRADTATVTFMVVKLVWTVESDRSERTAVFGNTKLCKFHVLGVCQKGAACNFAHDPSQLNNLPDLAKTRVCKTLISTGRCDDPQCSYAHSKEELREMPSAPERMPSSDKHACAAQPQAAPVPLPVISGAPSAAQINHPVMPNFAWRHGQAPCTAGQDPAVQVLMLQQMAAFLSMQAAMLQAGQAPAQPHAFVQPPAQCPASQKEMHHSRKSSEEKISVELNALTFTETYPEFSKFADDEPAKLPTDYILDPLPMYSNPLCFDHKQEIGEKNFQDTPILQGVTGVKVKNTFIDFEPERRSDGMRAVKTCLGGFSFMTGSDDDDDDEA